MGFDIGVFFEKSVENVKFSLKYDQHKGTMPGPVHVYGQISLRSSANENSAGRNCRKKSRNKHLCSIS